MDENRIFYPRHRNARWTRCQNHLAVTPSTLFIIVQDWLVVRRFLLDSPFKVPSEQNTHNTTPYEKESPQDRPSVDWLPLIYSREYKPPEEQEHLEHQRVDSSCTCATHTLVSPFFLPSRRSHNKQQAWRPRHSHTLFREGLLQASHAPDRGRPHNVGNGLVEEFPER